MIWILSEKFEVSNLLEHIIFLKVLELFCFDSIISICYNRLKYGDWSPTRIINDGSDLEQQGSE